jgi:hypothetical protein
VQLKNGGVWRKKIRSSHNKHKNPKIQKSKNPKIKGVREIKGIPFNNPQQSSHSGFLHIL